MFAKFKHWLSYRTVPTEITFQSQMVTVHQQRLKIRRATSKDVSRMVAIERVIFGTPPWSAASFDLELSRQRDRLYLVVINDCAELVGYAGCSFNWYRRVSHITNIAVDPASQNQGIGTILITTLQQVSRNDGIDEMSLEVRASNLRARELYERMGFRQSKIKRGYYLDDREDAVEMKVNLKNKGEK